MPFINIGFREIKTDLTNVWSFVFSNDLDPMGSREFQID